MIKVALVRGKYFNNFEGQNYLFPAKSGIAITAISSQYPIHSSSNISLIKLPSLSDWPMPKYILNRLLGDSQILFGLEKFARDFDLFHTADPHYYYSYQLAKLRSEKKIKKLIVTSWETIPFNNESVKKKKGIKQFVLQQADQFICYTEKAKQALIQEGVNSDKIVVIRLGVDVSRFVPVQTKPVKKAITILYVGRLVEEKGIKILYQAYKQLIKKLDKGKADQKVIFNIVGQGPLEQWLMEQITKDCLNKTVQMSVINYEKIEKIYQKADIFVLPSFRSKIWEEQYGMVLIEAMSSGLAIVATDSGAIPELIDQSGIIVPEKNVDQLIQALSKLVINENLRLKLRQSARTRALTYFDSRKTMANLARIYKEVSLSSL